MANKETLLDWLRDAYAMETQAIEILEKQASRLEHYPDFRQKVAEHVEVTRRQADRVRQLLQQLGSDTSALKTGFASFTGNVQAMMAALAGDEAVKSAMADYAFEHFEIASYRCLIGAADELGLPEVKRVCDEILHEEEAMASWLEERLPVITRQYLAREGDARFRAAKA